VFAYAISLLTTHTQQQTFNRITRVTSDYSYISLHCRNIPLCGLWNYYSNMIYRSTLSKYLQELALDAARRL